MAAMATWAHRLVASIESLTLKDAAARFANFVLSRLGESDSSVIDLNMPKQMLASHLGITGETLSRLLARFEADGIIVSQGRRIKVLSVRDLKEIHLS